MVGARLVGARPRLAVGAVTLEGFLDVVMAVVTAAAWPEILAAFAGGVVVGTLLDFAWCEFSQ